MIDSAVKILGPVPASHIDPLLLVQSQAPDVSGYVEIAHPDGAEGPFYDILMFSAGDVFGAYRLMPDIRFPLDTASVLESFRTRKGDPSVTVSLFAAGLEQLAAFSDTFTYEPSLKLKPRLMSRSQIVTLLESIQSDNSYLEVSDFTDASAPFISILRMNHRPGAVSETLSGFTNSRLRASERLLLYDIDRNRSALSCRKAAPPPVASSDSSESLDSILRSILSATPAPLHPKTPATSITPPPEQLAEATPAEGAVPPDHASPVLVALFVELRSALIALLGRARAARVLRRALASSQASEPVDLDLLFDADPPPLGREDAARAVIAAIIDSPGYLALNRHKSREKLARILSDRYSRDYTSCSDDELTFLESLWKKLTK